MSADFPSNLSNPFSQSGTTGITHLMVTSAAVKINHGAIILISKHIVMLRKVMLAEKGPSLVVILIMTILGLAGLFSLSMAALVIGLVLLGLAGLAIWSRMNSRTFALELEMSSGNKFYMYSKDERFIEQVIEKITAQIEDGTCGKLEVDVLAKSQHELP